MGAAKQVKAGSVLIGGGAPVSIQSMTNTDTRDVGATLEQIKALAASGCDLVRVSGAGGSKPGAAGGGYSF